MVNDENSRFYLDYASQHDALLGILNLYEQLLKQKNPDKTKLTYSLADVMNFVDQLHEITLLEFEKEQKGFRPHGRIWIKELLAETIKKE